MPVKIDYLGHSGFFVETDSVLLLFDYYYGDLSFLEEKLDENFKQCIINFTNEKLPQIYKLLDKYKMNHSIFIFKSRDEADNYIRNMEKKYANI